SDGSESPNEVMKEIDKSENPNAILRELVLTTAIAQHGMHQHLERKNFTARRDVFSDELYQSKINKFDILLVTRGEVKDENDPSQFEFLRKLSRNHDDSPVIAKMGNDLFMYGFSDGNWSIKKVQSDTLN